MSIESFWVDEPRAFLLAEGPDASSYLQSQLSQDLSPLAIAASVYSLVLEPSGRAIAVVRVTRTGADSFVLDTDPAAGEAVLTRLARFKIRVKAELSTLDWRCLAVRGPGAAGIGAPDGTLAIAAWRGDGADLIGPSPAPPAGIAEGTSDDLLAARVDAGWPVAAVDYDPGEPIPAALGVTAEAVSFTKGCYPGQELVERMDSRGASAPRTLQVVDVPAGTNAGDEVEVDGRSVRVTSVAGTRAIALVQR